MRVVFIQNKGGNYGGVWQVNKIVGENLIKDGYDVSIISIRDDHLGLKLEHDDRLKLITINEKDLWHTHHLEDFKESIRNHHYLELIKRLYERLLNNFKLKKDIKKLNKYLEDVNPDYIITSQYQLLDMLDEKYLCKTFHEQHLNFRESFRHPATRDTLVKYKDLVTYIWLCEKTKEEAIKNGLKNSISIYNAVRFETKDRALVVKNKKLVTIARLSKEKRIDKMVDIVEELFNDKKYSNWSLEIYGDGEEYENIKKLIKSSQIKLMGSTSNPKDALLNSSINLNTSAFEGFSLSILEASECGIPTVTFDFGESVEEEIVNGKTGFIAKDKNDYIKKLQMLMDNDNLLNEMSINTKKNNEKFHINKIINEWEKVLK